LKFNLSYSFQQFNWKCTLNEDFCEWNKRAQFIEAGFIKKGFNSIYRSKKFFVQPYGERKFLCKKSKQKQTSSTPHFWGPKMKLFLPLHPHKIINLISESTREKKPKTVITSKYSR